MIKKWAKTANPGEKKILSTTKKVFYHDDIEKKKKLRMMYLDLLYGFSAHTGSFVTAGGDSPSLFMANTWTVYHQVFSKENI